MSVIKGKLWSVLGIAIVAAVLVAIYDLLRVVITRFHVSPCLVN